MQKWNVLSIGYVYFPSNYLNVPIPIVIIVMINYQAVPLLVLLCGWLLAVDCWSRAERVLFSHFFNLLIACSVITSWKLTMNE